MGTKFSEQGTNLKTRSDNSLKTRCNRHISKDIATFVGILVNCLREYHIGWVFDDYFNEAMQIWREQNNNKGFRFEACYKGFRVLGLELGPSNLDRTICQINLDFDRCWGAFQVVIRPIYVSFLLQTAFVWLEDIQDTFHHHCPL